MDKNIRLLVLADMEGCLGLYDMTDRTAGQSHMKKEIAAIIENLNSTNKYDITVVDCHDSGRNLLDLREKYPQVMFVSHIWNIADLDKYDCAIMTGFHGQRGSNGWFAHTLRPEIICAKLGDRQVGEIELFANYLAYYNVPVSAISGDEAAREEAFCIGAVFYPTKRINEKKNIATEDYLQLAEWFVNSLKEPTAKHYDPSKVELFLSDEMYPDYLPEAIFKTTSASVVFEDTVEFMNKIFSLCMYLNCIVAISSESYRRLRNIIQCEFTREEFEIVYSQYDLPVFSRDRSKIKLLDLRRTKEILSRLCKRTNTNMLMD